MWIKKWDSLPHKFINEHVQKYYDTLYKRRKELLYKRIFDVVVSIILLIIILPLIILVSILIKIDSNGAVIFKQIRITQYGKRFKILKFRSMYVNFENTGNYLTIKNDSRVTKVGKYLRRYRLDEIPQLFNILSGDMSFVGTRPEVLKYVIRYNEEMMATLLLPAGLTSQASIDFKDEDNILNFFCNADDMYVNVILPKKMQINLFNVINYSFFNDLKILLNTALYIFIKNEYCNDNADMK